MGSLHSYAQDVKANDQLKQLRQKNDLAEWIYTGIDQAVADSKHTEDLYRIQKQAWRQPKNMDEHVAWLTLTSTQGYERLQAGDILASINYYEDAYKYFKKHQAFEFDIASYVLKPLGNNYTRLGDYERAIFIQQKVISSLDAKEQTDEIATQYSNIAISYYNMGNFMAARQSVDKGLKLTKDPQVLTGLNNTLADILFQQDSLARAEWVIIRNIASQNKVDQQTAFRLMSSYTSLGNIRFKLGQISAAEQSYRSALRLINTYYADERQREKAFVTTQLGKIANTQGQWQQAIKLLNTSLRILRINDDRDLTDPAKIYGENKLVEVFREKASVYLKLDRPENAFEQLRFALSANDKIRAEFADDRTKERLQQENKELAGEAIDLAYALSQGPQGKKYLPLILEISEQCRSRTLADQVQRNNRKIKASGNDTLQKKRANIEQGITYNQRLSLTGKDTALYQKKIAALKFDLALLDKDNHRADAAKILSPDALLKALSAGVRYIEYFIGERTAYAINIKDQKVERVIKLSPADTVRKQVARLVNTYYRKGPDAALNAPKSFYQLSNAVYSTLLGDINIRDNERVCIIPDDVLGYLSFDGLITGKKFDPAISQWPFLIRKATITYAFSLNTIAINSYRHNTNSGFSGLFITHEKANDKPILAVKTEADAINKLVGGKMLYDDDVNSASFFKAFGNSSALHISTHAYLSGSNNEPTIDLGQQKLFLFELQATPNKPQLVVLSACRTGDGMLANGEGIISFSRGFSAIGTPATIAGLWNVNDDAAAIITAKTYKGMLIGLSTGEALHQAKLEWLNSDRPADAMYLPYYWDSLILMGADEHVNLHSGSRDVWMFAIAGVLLMIISLLTLSKIRQKRRRR
ncbi:CHAT domain-containing protein [Mucilaginibacter myungsuensis]|uniref:CHAT domain-containing protein n=1 Tax=Mucilaginibacter myungsuensis TaxID=649104 RepID=UPI0025B561F3|nr:CHAT domain-containing tetratricopeptide repeat protein [Mucilaginibacter myungsuensis]